jgi:hypothetical protein
MIAGMAAATQTWEDNRRWETILWIVLAALWVVAFAYRLSFCVSQDYEEVGDGLLAAGIVDGFATSPRLYTYGESYGPVVYGLLLSPIYWAAGSHALWIKLLGFLFLSAGVGLWTLLLRQAWGFAPAVLFFLFCLLPPPLFGENASVFKANHLDSIFYGGLLLYLFQRQSNDLPSRKAVAGFGLLAGFASFFCLQNLPVCAAAGVMTVWKWRWRGLARAIWPGAACFALAFSPYVLLRAGPRPPVGGGASPEFWRRLIDLGGELPRLAGYDIAWLPHLSLIFFVAAIGGLILANFDVVATGFFHCPTTAADRLSRLLALFLVFWIAAFATAHGGFYSRYFLPIFPILTAFACFLLGRAPSFLKWAVAAPFLIAGFVNFAAIFPGDLVAFSQNWRTLVGFRGEDYQVIVNRLHLGWDGDIDAAARSIARLPRRWRDDGWVSVGRWLEPEKVLTLLLQQPPARPQERPFIAFGLGRKLEPEIEPRACPEPDEAPGAGPREALPAAWRERLAQVDAEAAGEAASGAVMQYLENEKRTETQRARDAICAHDALVRHLRAVFRQLDDAAFRRAMLRGAGIFYGDQIVLPTPREADGIVASWTAPPGDELSAEFLESGRRDLVAGLAEGYAQWLITERHRFRYYGEADVLPPLRDRLARRGVTLRTIDPRRREYALDLLK